MLVICIKRWAALPSVSPHSVSEDHRNSQRFTCSIHTRKRLYLPPTNSVIRSPRGPRTRHSDPYTRWPPELPRLPSATYVVLTSNVQFFVPISSSQAVVVTKRSPFPHCTLTIADTNDTRSRRNFWVVGRLAISLQSCVSVTGYRTEMGQFWCKANRSCIKVSYKY